MSKESLKMALDSQDFYELMQAYRHAPLTQLKQTIDAFEDVKAFIVAIGAQQAQPPAPLQGGMSNETLMHEWQKKLPGKVPEGQELGAFAVGVEVGFDHARKLEKEDWSRVHHVLKKHGVHPGRTDDRLDDVIDRALSAAPAVPAVQPLTDEEIALAIFEARVGQSPFKRDGSTSFRIARAAIAKFCEVNGIAAPGSADHD